MTYISSAQLDGLTGPISFTEGKRTDFKLDLLKLEHDKMKKVGDWNPIQGLNITDPYAFMQGQEIIHLNYFFKWANPGLFLFIFGLFKQTIQFLQQINVKKCHVHPVSSAGIQTHDLLNVSRLQ